MLLCGFFVMFVVNQNKDKMKYYIKVLSIVQLLCAVTVMMLIVSLIAKEWNNTTSHVIVVLGVMAMIMQLLKEIAKGDKDQNAEAVEKTAIEWFSDLPSPIKELAIENSSNIAKENGLYTSLCEALVRYFVWEDTKQGHDFWGLVYDGKYKRAIKKLKQNGSKTPNT